jgi:hypothetical protein
MVANSGDQLKADCRESGGRRPPQPAEGLARLIYGESGGGLGVDLVGPSWVAQVGGQKPLAIGHKDAFKLYDVAGSSFIGFI